MEEQVIDRVDPVDRPVEQVEVALRERETWSDEDRMVAQLMSDDVRSTTPYARALGINHLPVEQQRTEVKRAKDRISKRFKKIRSRR